jgi:NADH dehydrogenase [ubiquinone] 1 alpha subcomplex assembly factor 7
MAPIVPDGVPPGQQSQGPLTALLQARIRQCGPMRFDQFMAEALCHPRHGYYIAHDPFGVDGDFTTAPEISQMFGEMIGVWAVDAWLRLGCPDPFALVELGPGRGTLMADLWRATAHVPGFHAAARLHLIEVSPLLRARQEATLAPLSVPAHWHSDLDAVADLPIIAVANEFFDALPVRQYEWMGGQWGERMVGLDAQGAFALTLNPATAQPAPLSRVLAVPPALGAALGAVRETCPGGAAVAASLGRRLGRCGGAALIIDYGYDGPAIGDTVQALRQHRPCSPLLAPGLCDVTAHVDFTALATEAQAQGAGRATPFPSPGQGDFLRAMGIEARAARLKAGASAAQAEAIDAALFRLTDATQMGALFKTLILTGCRV